MGVFYQMVREEGVGRVHMVYRRQVEKEAVDM